LPCAARGRQGIGPALARRFRQGATRWLVVACCAVVQLSALADETSPNAGPNANPDTSTSAKPDRKLLDALRTRISMLDRKLNQSRMSRDAHASKLRGIEQRISKLAATLAGLSNRIEQSAGKMMRLQNQRGQLQAKVATQQNNLAQQIRATYALGQQGPLHLLLNVEDPARVSRLLTYHGYFSRSRAVLIKALSADVEALNTLAKRLEGRDRELKNLHSDASQTRSRLEGHGQEQQLALKALNSAIKAGGNRLSQLRDDEKHLLELLQGIQEAVSEPALAGEHRLDFNETRGQLPWPVSGAVEGQFGTRRGGGGLTWQGVLIKAEAGTEVRAISHGRVAYADWLRGYGMLVILDHGDGYMSLYGQNRSLLAKVGDWVDAQTPVATVGNSGGGERPGLYFEIRRQGQPQNPRRWCRKSDATKDT